MSSMCSGGATVPMSPFHIKTGKFIQLYNNNKSESVHTFNI